MIWFLIILALRRKLEANPQWSQRYMSYSIAIIIPTLKTRQEINPMIDLINNTVPKGTHIIPTCIHQSASKNRNHGLHKASADYIIQVDDDVSGFFPGWAEKLIQPLVENPDIMLVSAELVPTAHVVNQLKGYAILNRPVLASACWAHRKTHIRFDENYYGSGMEDNDFCLQMHKAYPKGKIAVNYDVKLIHAAEKKGRTTETWQYNQEYHKAKWHGFGNINVLKKPKEGTI